MKAEEIVQDYEDYLLKNTSLSASSILKYVGEINNYFQHHDELRVSTVNEYLIKRYRDKKGLLVKYAFKHLFKQLGHLERYADLDSFKKNNKKRIYKSYDGEVVRNIIKHIKNRMYKDIAILQVVSGMRSHDILTMRHEHVDPDTNRAIIIAKGGREIFIEFPAEVMQKIILQYRKPTRGYMFLSPKIEQLEGIKQYKRIQSLKQWYYQQVKQAAVEVGCPEFGTHDFRRCFADTHYRINPNLRDLQSRLGHANITTTTIYLPPFSKEAKETMHKVAKEFLNIK